MRRVVALVAVLILGIWIGGHPQLLPGFTRDLLAGDDDVRVVGEAIERVHDDYYREVPVKTLAEAAVAGVVSSLGDRFSTAFTPAEYRHFRELTDSAYEGVGITVLPVERGLRIVNVLAGSPARASGLRPGDVIVRAAGRSLAGANANQGSRLIKGRPGTRVTLRVRRGDRERTLRVKRARVTVPVVAASLRKAGGADVGVVALSTFSTGAHGEVRAALRRLLRQGARGFVLDLRRNGGGLVTEARLVASAFLSKGTIVTTRGRSVPTTTLTATGDPVVRTQPLVVLVDRDTASASEIVAGALQDRGRAKVVGTHTFGKGVFQSVIPLSNGGALDITAGQYFTPSGRNLGQGIRTGAGIAPDVAARDDTATPSDEGLAAALRTVRAALR